MLILIPVLILLLASLAMFTVRLARPGFLYHWLIAFGGALAAWPVVMLAQFRLPQTFELFTWKPAVIFSSSPVLLVDNLSWPYAAALATLSLVVILTDVARAPEADWSTWSGVLGLGALGLLAVFAGNPLTLLLAWTAIDFVELGLLINQPISNAVRSQVVLAFSARFTGSLFLIAAILVVPSSEIGLTFGFIPTSSVLLLLLLSAGLRLGVLPVHLPFIQELPARRGLGTMSRLVPAAASLVLLARIANVVASSGQPFPYATYLLILSGLAAFYSGIFWFTAADELEGRAAWVLGLSSLSLAAAVHAQPGASLAWGVAAVFSGGLIFLSSARNRRISWITLLGLFGISALPFSPTWRGGLLFTAPFQPILLLFFIALILFLMGYARHALSPGESLEGLERWVWLIYPLGLGLLPVTHFLIGLWMSPAIGAVPAAGWLVGLMACSLAFLGVFWVLRRPSSRLTALSLVGSVFSLRWVYKGLGAILAAFEQVLTFLTAVLEGDGGILWGILLLALLITLFLRSAGG